MVTRVIWLVMACISLAAIQVQAKDREQTLPNGQPFQELQSQIFSLQEQIDLLVGRVSSIEERLTADQSAIAELQVRNVELEAKIIAYAGDIEAMQAQLANNNMMIAILESEIESIQDVAEIKQVVDSGVCPSGGNAIATGDGNGIGCLMHGGSQAVVFDVEISTYGSASASAICPKGFFVTGGGYRAPNIPFLSIYRNSPRDFDRGTGGVHYRNSWLVDASSRQYADMTWYLAAIAVCEK